MNARALCWWGKRSGLLEKSRSLEPPDGYQIIFWITKPFLAKQHDSQGVCAICASSAQSEALKNTGCHITNMFSQLFHQTPSRGDGYCQTPINPWIIPAFPLTCWTSSPSFRVSVTLQLPAAEWEKYLHAAAENLVYTGTSVNLLSLRSIAGAQTQCSFWGHHSVVTSSSSVPQNASVRLPPGFAVSSLSIPKQMGCCNRDRRQQSEVVTSQAQLVP